MIGTDILLVLLGLNMLIFQGSFSLGVSLYILGQGHITNISRFPILI